MQSQIKAIKSVLFPDTHLSITQNQKKHKSYEMAVECNTNTLNINNSLNSIHAVGSLSNQIIDSSIIQPSHSFNFLNSINVSQFQEVQPISNFEFDLISFKNKLAEWAVNNGISHTSLLTLLSILKTHTCFNDFPIDSRTLLNTPRNVNIKEINHGLYWHYGLKRGILSFINKNKIFCNSTIIELMIGIDGLPISKSSGSQLWPILGSIIGCNEVFVIGIYHSYSKKPESCEQFLSDFIEEAIDIVDNGLLYNNKKYPCKIKIICADAPAKSFILGVKGHTGYSSCTKCWDEGKNIERRICFSHVSGRKRTDEEFVLKSDNDYHNYACPLERIPNIGLVTNVPLDYLHLVCLGVMKKLLNLWCSDRLSVRLQFRKVKLISDKLEKLVKPYTPIEFQRKPRGLMFFRQWKATEFRQLLLYSGPVIFKSILSPDIYNNFLVLHFAITLLISKKFCFQENYLEYAENLLKHFVTSFRLIYGKHHVSHNVHGLLHLVDDVRHFGPLDTFSSFRFENFMQKLKVLIKKDDKPLQQIAKRLQEIDIYGIKSQHNKNIQVKISLKNKHASGPIINGCTIQYSVLKLEGMTFDINSKANNCRELRNGKIVIIDNFCYNEKFQDNIIIGKEFLNIKPLYTLPSSSSNLGIYEVSKLSQQLSWPVKFIIGKYFLFPISYDHLMFAAMPLLHIDQEERPYL